MAIPWRQKQAPRQIFRLIPLGQIRPNPHQPRTRFDPQALQSLAESVGRYGIITPLTVRQEGEGYVLISGERRLRAAAMAGLTAAPCYILSPTEEESALMALLENLQREDLDWYEEAAFLRRLCQEFHMTQQDAAQRVGKTQSAVANKLRLLKLSPDTVQTLRQYGLTERHARALLPLPEEQRQPAAAAMGEREMTVAQGEAYVEKLLAAQPRPKRQGMIRDVRLFCNTMERAVKLMQSAGLPAKMERRQEGRELVFTVRVPAAPGREEGQAPSGPAADEP